MSKDICDQVFGAADGFFGEEWGMHALASKSSFSRGNGKVGVVYRGSGVKWDVFLKMRANPVDPSRYKNKGYLGVSGRLAD